MCIAAIVILIFFIPYTASGFKAIGTLFSSLFGVEYHVAMIVGASSNRRLHRHGRFYGRIYHRPDSEYCYEYFSGGYRILRNPSGRRLGRGYGIMRTHWPDIFAMTQMHDGATNTASPYSLLTICIYHGVGTGVFRNASYPASFYGYRRRE